MDAKLYSVQYLRGLAAVLVVIAHASAHPLLAPTYLQLRLGQFGVYLFFVISGFIMVAISGAGKFSALEFLNDQPCGPIAHPVAPHGAQQDGD